MADGYPYRTPGERDARSRVGNVGGTPGGIGEFLIGLAMLIGGGYLFLDNVVVTGNFWSQLGSGQNAFGLVLLPLLAGIAILFFNGKSWLGWILTGGAAVAIVLGIIVRMSLHWRSTSLFNTLVILVLMAGGIGLIARSMRAHGRARD